MKWTRSPKTIADFTPNVRRFIELHGDLGIKDITRQHCREFKEAMIQVPARLPKSLSGESLPVVVEQTRDDPSMRRLSLKTVNEKALATLSAVLGWADGQGFRDGNPARGLKIRGGKFAAGGRLPYTIEDLSMIFRFPVFTEDKRPKGGGGEAANWLPLLAPFTGARLEELGQLRVGDVRQSEGIWFLDMATIHGEQRLKNETSRRHVPIHSKLIELGLLDYANSVKSAGQPWLFPDLRSQRQQRTAAFSQWWGRYARTHGIADRRKVFHSFRHTVKDGFREAEVSKDLFDAIQGHSPKDVSGGYGRGYTLRRVAEAMECLRYPGLSLSHLLPTNP
jgi:integrase